MLRLAGRLLVTDIQHTGEYAVRLRERGMLEVEERALGWWIWYGGPWMATRLVCATKPA